MQVFLQIVAFSLQTDGWVWTASSDKREAPFLKSPISIKIIATCSACIRDPSSASSETQGQSVETRRASPDSRPVSTDCPWVSEDVRDHIFP